MRESPCSVCGRLSLCQPFPAVLQDARTGYNERQSARRTAEKGPAGDGTSEIQLILAYSIVFLVAVGVATMLIVTEWQDTPPRLQRSPKRPPLRRPSRAPPHAGRDANHPQPTRTPRPTTTPAPTTVALAADDAITAANAAGLVQRGAIAEARRTRRTRSAALRGRPMAKSSPCRNRRTTAWRSTTPRRRN